MMFSGDVPLADRLRPTRLTELVGQDHLVGERGILQKCIATARIPSFILWGPPGTGKTTIAHIVAHEVNRRFCKLSAIDTGVKEIREIIRQSEVGNKTILFIDEIHRFSKSQQDALLGAVETGKITLIGATTENPSFEVNPALISRTQVYSLNVLTTKQLISIAERAIKEDIELKKDNIVLKETDVLLNFSGGDARKLLNMLELGVDNLKDKENKWITNDLMVQIAQQKMMRYDKKGEMHYDIISAFIKSIRGSDPNAALYYLARMIEGGEDVKFIARRLVILASEDIGNANPTALVLATSTFQAVHIIGYPEARIILSQCTVYLATSTKSNASYMGIKKASEEVRKSGDLPVPLHLRNVPTRLMKKIGYGKNYMYPHNFDNNFVSENYLPDAIQETQFYEPGNNPREKEIRKFLKEKWKEKYGY